MSVLQGDVFKWLVKSEKMSASNEEANQDNRQPIARTQDQELPSPKAQPLPSARPRPDLPHNLDRVHYTCHSNGEKARFRFNLKMLGRKDAVFIAVNQDHVNPSTVRNWLTPDELQKPLPSSSHQTYGWWQEASIY